MNYEITGLIKLIDRENVVTDAFKKRDLVITSEEQYTNDILLQFVQDKCAVLDHYRHGERVKIKFNIKGREWTSPQGEIRYFNTFQAWAIERTNQQPAAGTPAPRTTHAGDDFLNNKNSGPKEVPQAANQANDDEHDDLPF